MFPSLLAVSNVVALKREYRNLALQHHPDHGGNPETFKALVSEYKRLLRSFPDNLVLPKATTDGTPLSELGLGIDPKLSARECDCCEGKGYRTTREAIWAACSGCEGVGMVDPSIRYPRGGFLPRRCYVCRGFGYRELPEGFVHYERCYHCTGTGEIRLYNPVIPRNRLAG